MPTRVKSVMMMLFASVVLGNPILAQVPADEEAGLMPYGSYVGGKIDDVNMKNGNVFVHVPLFSIPQRGRLNLSFSVYANTPAYSRGKTCTGYGDPTQYSYYEYCDYRYTLNESDWVGAHVVHDQDVADAGEMYTFCTSECQNMGRYILYSVKDATGAKHYLGYDPSANLTTLRSFDGSGYLLVPGILNPYQQYSSQGTLYTSDGVAHSGGTSVTVTDPDGNYIITTNDGVITDTAGRHIPSSTSSNDTACPDLNLPYQPLNGSVVAVEPGPSGGTYTFCYTKIRVHTNFLGNNGQSVVFTSPLNNESRYTFYEEDSTYYPLQSVVLPNGTFWAFVYDAADPANPNSIAYGDLVEVRMPTAGTVSYTFDNNAMCWDDYNTDNPDTYYPKYIRSLLSRTTNPLIGASATKSYVFSFVDRSTQSFENSTSAGDETVKFTFSKNGETAGTCNYAETSRKYYQGTTLLKTESTQYVNTNSSQAAAIIFAAGGSAGDSAADQVLPLSVSTTLDDGSTSTTTYTYDNGFTNVQPWCYIVNPPSGEPWCNTNPANTTFPVQLGLQVAAVTTDYGGTTAIKTETTYKWQEDGTYYAANLLELPAAVVIRDQNNAQVAATTYGYDELSLQASGVAQSHNSTVPGPRGHATSINRWLDLTGGSLTSTSKYYDTGMLYKTEDPGTHATTYEYSPTGAGTYVSKVTNDVGHHTDYAYDSGTEKLTSVTDPNQNLTTYGYNDPLRRLTTINYPPTDPQDQSHHGQKIFDYNDSARTITITRTATPDLPIVTTTTYDGLGRLSRSATSKSDCASGYVSSDTTYDAMGRISTVSQPYCSINDPKYNMATTYGYDTLGRVRSVTQPDGSTVTTSYHGPAASVSDEGNGTTRMRRISQSDALGRVRYVCEVASQAQQGSNGNVPSDCRLGIAGTGFLTGYNYNTLGNLTKVTQAGIADREFIYDSLSRLHSATNPESGTTTYDYDVDDNVITKTDARGVSTHYTYENLHRLIGKTYTGEPQGQAATPAVSFRYDESSGWGSALENAIGRKTSETTAAGAASIFSYDPMGHVWFQRQCTPRTCGTSDYRIDYTYDDAGSLRSASNGLTGDSAATWTYTYDAGAGLASVSSSLADMNRPATLFTNAHYGPFGLTAATYGNGIQHSITYSDQRGWPTRISDLGPTPASTGAGYVSFSGGNERSTQVVVQDAKAGSGNLTVNGSEQSKEVLVQNATTGQGNVTINPSNGTAQSKQVLAQPAAGGTGSVTVNGGEQSKQVQTQPATQSTATIAISGAEQSRGDMVCQWWVDEETCGLWVYQQVYDSGTVSVTVNGFTASTRYGQGTTPSNIAQTLASWLNDGSSPVTAYNSGTSVYITSKAYGSSVNYPISTSSWSDDPDHFGEGSFLADAPVNMSGGQDAAYTTVYDGGTVTVSVNGHSNSASWGNGSTAAGIASSLASNINADGGASVAASPSGSTVYLTAKSTGAETNYSLTSSYTYDSGHFGSSSFTTSNSSSTLTGGHDAVYNTVYDSGSVTITVNGHANSTGWGQGATSSGIASALASNINGDGGAYVTASASGSTVYLTSRITGVAANYGLSSSYTYDSSNFLSSSFTTANSGSALTGGRDAGYNTIYDSGTLSVVVNGHTNSVNWGQGSTSPGIASALASAINSDLGASVSATVASNVVTLTAKTTGSSTNYSLSSSYIYDSANFATPSFTGSSASALGGGADVQYNTVFDSGTVSVTVNGLNKTVAYGQSATADGIASALASAFNGDAASAVTANAQGGTLSLTAKQTGSSTNYSLSASSSTNSADFSGTSFPATTSGSTLTGGADQGAGTYTAYSFNIADPNTGNSGYAPNGNVLFANDSVNGAWAYTYDEFNRLLTAVSANRGEGCSWDYDRYGNRWEEKPYNGSCYTSNFTFRGGNNRIDGADLYDAAGNLIRDPLDTRWAYRYDAENRLTEVWESGNLVASYIYDAEGRRVRRDGGSMSVEFLYDIAGRVVTEVSAIDGTWDRSEIYAGGQHLGTYRNGTTYFSHNDWLGTERARTDMQATINQTCTSLPFGDGLNCTPGGVNPNPPSPLFFTGKERDSESGLDYFGARYFGSSAGRFMSSDPVFFQAEMLTDPQRFNQYAYVRNNPLALVDPKGEAIELTCESTDPGECAVERQEQLRAWRALVGAAGKYLYDNIYTDANGNTGHYLGIYTNGPAGKGPAFEDINDVTAALSEIVNDSRIGQLDLKPAGSTATDGYYVEYRMGPLQEGKAATPGVTLYNSKDQKWHFNVLDKGPYGTLPKSIMSNGEPGILNQNILLGHEALGHGFDSPGPASDRKAVELENKVRRLKNPQAPQRRQHEPY